MELPIRKTGVRRQRNKVSVDGGSVPRVQPTQDPGVNATQGAFGEQQAEDLFDTGESIRKFAEDRSDRLLKAQERIRAKQVLNSRLELDNKFVVGARELQQKHVTEDTISGKDFPNSYGAELNDLQMKILEEASQSGEFTQEDLLEFENDLIKSHNTESNSAIIKHQEAFSAKQGKLVDKSVMAVRESSEFANAETFTKKLALIDEQVRRFNPVLSETQQDAIANKHIREEAIPRFNVLLNGGDLEEAELLLNRRRVKEAFGEDQFRQLSDKVSSRQGALLKAATELDIKRENFRRQNGLPPGSALTPDQEILVASGKLSPTQIGKNKREEFRGTVGRDPDEKEAVKLAGAAESGPLVTFIEEEAFSKSLGKGRAKTVLELESDGAQAQNDLVQIQLMRAAFESGNFRTGPVADLRQFASQIAIFMGAPQSVLAKIGDAKTADIIQSSISTLAIDRAENLSRMTNLSISLVKDSFPKLSRTLEGNIILAKIFERVAERRVEVSSIASRMADEFKTLTPKGEKSFFERRADLERSDPVISQRLRDEIAQVSQSAPPPVETKDVESGVEKVKKAAGTALERLKEAFGSDKEVSTEVPKDVSVPEGVEFMGTDGDQAILKLKGGSIVKGPLANLKKKGKK